MGARQRGMVHKKPNGKWYARYYTHSGKRPQIGPFGTKQEAVRALSEVMSAIGKGATMEDITFGEFSERFLATYDAQPATVVRMTGNIRLINARFGSVKLDKIRPEHVAEWRKTVSEGQRHQVHGVLRQVLKAAVTWGYAIRNPAGEIKNTTAPKKEVLFFDGWDEIIRISDELPESQRAIPIFAAGTGLRPSEWCALTWADITQDYVSVNKSWTELGGLKSYGKTEGSRRRVPLRKFVRDALAPLERTNGLVFQSKHGDTVRIGAWRKTEWKRAMETANLAYRKPYAMRHSYASWCLAAGMNTFVLARRMGTSVQMIDDTYGHLISDSIEREIALLDDFDNLA